MNVKPETINFLPAGREYSVALDTFVGPMVLEAQIVYILPSCPIGTNRLYIGMYD
jgi:hypothetical protein